ncbi:VOC family protein [Mesorhizobium sp. BR1-1-16]|uniref:VOC family protein n=1 Tax=Mesorhizobium sp. BR1-1-16 TaxID=2876653 RepID=UPI001CCBA5E5|nr:VOC family protein [Mesorhizobium sp. BR1-1-16]MBZ9936088.1 VOC family protein [Mesorhizobium sp. BR1-1-16]
MAIIDIDHVQIAMPRGAEDVARQFYGGVLGLIEIAKPTNLAGRGGVWFMAGPRQLHIGVEEEFRPARKAHPAFRVDDLEGLRARCIAAGLSPVDDELLPGFRRFYLSDPFGNRLEFLMAAD